MRPGPRQRARADEGAATLETTGMWGMAAVLVVTLAAVLLASTPVLSDSARRAICLVMTVGQGDCASGVTTAAEHRPDEPCVLQADGRDSKAKGTFLFVNASTGERWLVERLSDGTFRVTRGTGGAVGAEAGVGVTAHVVWDDKAYGVDLNAGVSGELGFAGGEVYSAQDDAAVSALLKKHGIDVAADNLLGNGVVRSVVDTLAGWVGSDHALPEPDDVYIEGGLTLDAGAQATWLAAGAKGSVGTSTVLGVKIRKDGSNTEYLSSTVSGEVSAGSWYGADDGSNQYAQVKAQGSVKQVVELDRDRNGNVTAVRTRTIVAGEAGATAAGRGPSGKTYTEQVVELPVRTASDRALAARYLAAVGVQRAAGLVPGPGTVLTAPLAYAAASAFNDAARARGFVTEQTFDASSAAYGLEASGGLIAKGGGSVMVNTIGRTSEGGRYWDGTQWQPWSECG